MSDIEREFKKTFNSITTILCELIDLRDMYLEKYGRPGWKYNLGNPSFNPEPTELELKKLQPIIELINNQFIPFNKTFVEQLIKEL